MRDGVRKTTSGRRIAGAIGVAVVVGTMLVSLSSAQQGSSGRLNKIIEQFENGEPSLVGDHWQLNDLEHNPFQVDEFESFLNELEV